jgi:hypothetical protein
MTKQLLIAALLVSASAVSFAQPTAPSAAPAATAAQ